MDLMVNPVITDFQQDVNGDIKMLKIGQKKEDAYANIIGQAEGGDLDNNKTATINVSTYTEPVEILPTEGKDGMKKATVTLSNIPSGTLYAWKNIIQECIYTTTSNPTTSSSCYQPQDTLAPVEIVAVSEGTISIEVLGETTVYSRSSEDDISLT